MSRGISIEALVDAVEAARPRPSVVVPTMSAVHPYVARGLSPWDFAYLPSSMGQAVPFALGVALGRPDLPVCALVGDGSLVMNLGCLSTATEAAARNLRIVVVRNGVYQVTGGQAVVGGEAVDLVAVARGCGLPHAWRLEDGADPVVALRALFAADGCALLDVPVTPVDDAPPARSPGPAAARFERWRRRLVGDPPEGDA
ncbi:MAG: hypothetical protein D6705_03780 [Deltaproteobacteria bacterium]|nr:MAG: hypothetical protein D6705_03780 [Deltaproteobacteria bacterium]